VATTSGLDIEKITPQTVATSALDALKRGEADAVVDDLSRDIKAGRHDELNLIYPNVEEQVRRGRGRMPSEESQRRAGAIDRQRLSEAFTTRESGSVTLIRPSGVAGG
jgi:hypothetical protein